MERPPEVYLADGEHIDYAGNRTKGKEALAKLRGGVPGTVPRTITGAEMVTPDIAIVRVNADFPENKIRLLETYLMIRDAGQWKIRVHQAERVPLTP